MRAKRYPVMHHPINNESKLFKENYLMLLLTITSFEPSQLQESLLYVHRIAFGADYLEKDEHLEDVFLRSQLLEEEQLDECTQMFGKSDYRLLLVLEMILLTGGFEDGKQQALEYVSQLCYLLSISKEQLIFLSNMAVVILTGDLDRYHCEIENTYSIFDIYIEDVLKNVERKMIYPNINYAITEDVLAGILSVAKFGTNIMKKFVFSSAENYIENGKIVSECLYVGEYESPQSERHRKYEQSLDGRGFLFRKKLGKNQHKKPVGVVTHYLDSRELALKYFIEQGGIENE